MPISDNITTPMLSIKDIAARLNMSESGIRKLIKRKQVEGKRLGHRTLRFTEDQFNGLI